MDDGMHATMGWVRRSNAQGGACERAERRVEYCWSGAGAWRVLRRRTGPISEAERGRE